MALIDPTVCYDSVRVVKTQTGYMEIGDDLGFLAVCYSDPGTEVELDNKASIDTQPAQSLDERSAVTIDKALEAPIDSDSANKIDDFTKGSINSWENDYYQPSSAIHTAIPSKRKISDMEADEYDEDYREGEMTEYRGLAMEEAIILKTSHETRGETSIDSNYKPSIDTHHETKSDTIEEDDADYGYLRPDEFCIFRDPEGQARVLDGRVIQISKYVA